MRPRNIFHITRVRSSTVTERSKASLPRAHTVDPNCETRDLTRIFSRLRLDLNSDVKSKVLHKSKRIAKFTTKNRLRGKAKPLGLLRRTIPQGNASDGMYVFHPRVVIELRQDEDEKKSEQHSFNTGSSKVHPLEPILLRKSPDPEKFNALYNKLVIPLTPPLYYLVDLRNSYYCQRNTLQARTIKKHFKKAFYTFKEDEEFELVSQQELTKRRVFLPIFEERRCRKNNLFIELEGVILESENLFISHQVGNLNKKILVSYKLLNL